MLKREGITRDTNVDVENWFGVVKNTILQKKKNINAGLFIRKLHIQIKGSRAFFTYAFDEGNREKSRKSRGGLAKNPTEGKREEK